MIPVREEDHEHSAERYPHPGPHPVRSRLRIENGTRSVGAKAPGRQFRTRTGSYFGDPRFLTAKASQGYRVVGEVVTQINASGKIHVTTATYGGVIPTSRQTAPSDRPTLERATRGRRGRAGLDDVYVRDKNCALDTSILTPSVLRHHYRPGLLGVRQAGQRRPDEASHVVTRFAKVNIEELRHRVTTSAKAVDAMVTASEVIASLGPPFARNPCVAARAIEQLSVSVQSRNGVDRIFRHIAAGADVRNERPLQRISAVATRAIHPLVTIHPFAMCCLA
jgi:hypothetical protein